jgi:ESCRT-II complex subunit VPS36
MGRQLPFWHAVELSAGSRPVLRENEIDVLVEDGIGLYQGKAKILKRQNGRCYLTSQRIIYIDNANPKKYSLSVELDDVRSTEYTSKFLKSSPKIIIFFKRTKSSTDSKSTHKNNDISWICPICSFSNIMNEDLNYNNSEVLPVCETCGVKSDKEHIEETVKKYKSNRSQPTQIAVTLSQNKPNQITCNVCTFLNHPFLRNCEICGSSLPLNEQNIEILNKQEVFDDRVKIETESSDDLTKDNLYIKISFHSKGDKVFYDKLQEVLEKFNWDNLLKKGKVNQSVVSKNNKLIQNEKKQLSFGIHSITQTENIKNEKNQEIINSSLDDLDALLTKADEISELISSFRQLNQDSEDNRPFFKDSDTLSIVNNLSSGDLKSRRLYIQEISRKISEFLINDGILDEQGGIITLLDLYALFNRGRIGENLISPQDLYDSCLEFQSLKLPLSLKIINKLLVIQRNTEKHNLNKIISDIKEFIEKHGDTDVSHFRFSNVIRVSEFFNWSLNIAEEFLQIALELGELAIDKQIFGKHYYLNLFSTKLDQDLDKIGIEKGLVKDIEQTEDDGLISRFPELKVGRIIDSDQESSNSNAKELQGLLFAT